jgi:hypothetical protein
MVNISLEYLSPLIPLLAVGRFNKERNKQTQNNLKDVRHTLRGKLYKL